LRRKFGTEKREEGWLYIPKKLMGVKERKYKDRKVWMMELLPLSSSGIQFGSPIPL